MKLFGTPRILRRIAPRGLLARFLLILVTPILLVQIVAAYVFYDRHWGTVMRRLAIGIAGDVAAVVDLMTEYPEPAMRERVVRLARDHMDLMVDLQPGQVLPNAVKAPDDALEDAMSDALHERVRRPVMIETGMLEPDLHIYIQLSEGVLHVVAPRKRLFSSTTYVFVMWMVGTALVVLGIATIFMSNQVRSIRRLAASADGFGKGRDLPPIKPEGAREVRQAAQAFNVMRERIRRQIVQRTEMLAGVSHDLRTPLTRMKLQLAMMGSGPEIDDLQEDVAEMERMVEGYLAFARGEGQEPVTIADLSGLVEEVTARFARSGGAVELKGVEDPLLLPMRRNAVERCLSNLLSNALRYGTRIRVTLKRKGDSAEISVEDNGPGLREDQYEDVFRAFFRADPSRNSKTGGIGLGLTIARDVARVHGGDVLLSRSPKLGGLKALVRLPL